MKRAFGILALVLIMNAHTAAAAGIERLTLKEAIALALEKNHLVKAAGFSAEAARQGTGIAVSHYYPSLFFEESFAASNSPTRTFMMKLDEGRFTQNDFQINNLNRPASWHDFKTALTLQQPLYAPSLSPAREMAEKEAEKGRLALDAARQEVAFQVFRLYLDVRKSAAHLGAAELAVAEAREHLRLAVVRSAAGTGLRSDELRARTHLSSVEQQLITALNNLTLAKMQLAITCGLEDGVQLEVGDFPTPLADFPPVPDLTGTALETRSDLRRSRAELERSDAALRLADSAYLPAIGAFASYQLNAKDTPFGSDNDAWMAGVSLKWQIFDGFLRSRERDRAAATRYAAAEMLASGSKEIAFQVRESRLRREETGKRLEVARHALLDAEETVRLLSRRFENSLATMVELLDAQSALNQARASLAETESNHALAGGRVFYAAGTFVKEMQK